MLITISESLEMHTNLLRPMMMDTKKLREERVVGMVRAHEVTNLTMTIVLKEKHVIS